MSEAELIARMHTEWASGAPDLEYTPIADKLPELVRAEEVAALRARVAELERQLAAVPVGAIAEMLPGSNPRPAALVRQWIDGMIAECQP